ncbi:hypothetical protein AAFF_G00074880 [Aldrovandia affinis]|uniref:Reverse transcriptase/retrotransposon-derived protein RNase H-like domain-containing protein n=1 Tax=Aldrovandia affinis TaxID=143900 RepID=A0AAD7VXN9_9TELE|nr:hypothetical protein AAFF_G00074880 [Aldrovandia affinis]
MHQPHTHSVSANRREKSTLCFYHGKFGDKAKKCLPPCSWSGNALAAAALAALSVGPSSGLLFITDSISGRRFLCDTGAQVSILPVSALDIRTAKLGPNLEAANGTPIPTFGTRSLTLCFAGQRFSWDFVLAKVSTPLLGADFLCANGLLVDVGNRQLVNAETFCSLASARLDCQSAKCQFGVPSIDFLGHHITSAGATPLPLKVKAVLQFPRPTTVKALQEFLDRGVGAVLEQQIDGVWQPLAFVSRQLRASEQKYSTFDHIQHVAGKQNTVADCLSRTLTSTVHLGIDYARMAVDQDADPDIQAFRTATTGLQLVDVPFDDKGWTSSSFFGGFTHLLTMVDRTTRWPEVVPLSGTTTAEVARGFIGTWIARFGFLLTSPQTGDHNSPHNCGPLSPNSWVFHSIGLQHIIPRPMACVSVFTVP